MTNLTPQILRSRDRVFSGIEREAVVLSYVNNTINHAIEVAERAWETSPLNFEGTQLVRETHRFLGEEV